MKKITLGTITLLSLLTLGTAMDAQEVSAAENTYQTQETVTQHRIVWGDTLNKISQRYNVSVESIQVSNNIANPNLIFVGETLHIGEGNIQKAKKPVNKPVVQETKKVVVAEQPKPEVKPEAPKAEVKKEAVSAKKQGKTITVQATAYDAVSLGGVTASGYKVTSTSEKVIATDPRVIPTGTKVYVEGYGYATAKDTGGAIKGNIIDLNMSTRDAIQWGRKTVQVTILD